MARLCIDLGGTTVKIGIVESGAVLSTRSVDVTAEFALPDLEQAVTALLDRHDGPAPDAVGIAVPGVVDRRAGALLAAHGKYRALHGVDLTRWARERYGMPARVENDARAALLGEVAYGVAAGETDVVLMVLGTGIGTAAMMSGQLLRGAHDHAGILGGHLTVSLSGPSCPCGNIGCAEELASTRALGAVWDAEPGESDARPVLIETLVAAADAGDPKAIRVLDRFVAVWGATLVSLCHAYDPSVAVVSGGVMGAGGILPRLTEYVHAHLWTSSHRPAIVVPEHPQLSVMRGLASLADTTVQRTEVDR